MKNYSTNNYWSKFAAGENSNCILVDIPEELSIQIKQIQKNIPKKDLDEKDGLEKEHHVTILFGPKESPGDIFELLDEKYFPIKFKTSSKITYFDNSETKGQVVAKIDIIPNKNLKNLHNHLKKNTTNKDSWPTYKPHLTIAYLKPGCKIKQTEIKEIKWECDYIIYSDKNHDMIKIYPPKSVKFADNCFWTKFSSKSFENIKKGDFVVLKSKFFTEDEKIIPAGTLGMVTKSWHYNNEYAESNLMGGEVVEITFKNEMKDSFSLEELEEFFRYL